MSNASIAEYPSRIRFLHAVGKSTLRQGITVPVGAQTAWARASKKAKVFQWEFSFGDGHSANAQLRRINNSPAAISNLDTRVRSDRIFATIYRGSSQAEGRWHVGPLRSPRSGTEDSYFSRLPEIRASRQASRYASPSSTTCRLLLRAPIPELQQLGDALLTVEYRPDDGHRQYNSRIGRSSRRRVAEGSAAA